LVRRSHVVFDREKAAIERSHAAALEAAQVAAQDDRSAWRSALADKMKKESAAAEAAMREQLVKERDDELGVS
jgi:hypothetical protein